MPWTLPELIDIPDVQRLMDRFHGVTGIPIAILDSELNILVASGRQDICKIYHLSHPATADRCRQSADTIKSQLCSGTYVHYKCGNGLWEIAAPIIIGEKHLATLFLGQFFYEDEKIDQEFFRRQARECDFNLISYLAEVRRLPVFTREKVRQIMDLYTSLIGSLVSMGVAQYQQREAEKALRESEEQIKRLNSDLGCRAVELEAANRELEAFNFTVSHDLRTPLTVINSYSQALLELQGDRLGDSCGGFLKEIHCATGRMNELITTMLNFSRLSRKEMTWAEVDLTDLARMVSAQLKMAQIQRDVRFEIAEGLKMEGDEKLLRVALENLLGNAWKYTGGQERAVIEFGTVEIEGSPIFFVRDDGPGFDPAYADKLFRPFQRLPGTDNLPGHGIGLATVQRIVQRHDGLIWAEGEPGKGATFYFTFSSLPPTGLHSGT